ncbi:1,4-alpha-glucan branching protein domain-containing protein [Halalkalibacterium halodurans]|uniref:1,4-alpha-glucan branching protein domain-containing protein n=1 Tax=Halalkalibacterium halodurans TaxID=86665 RepID=UPI002AA9A573|nr:1,4-alpha-glucan branching protein domain-containing protein [Halalkalibacterium halodurans]MDY7221938.1 1,4-alpha-glucan branching protein domain-containing protein [Halalkalibacterium halodurans]MDY7241214.1 1,4-alpha-glucan branching protein domain-containing protein [Halalkalibacterium halodurans]
MREGYFSLVLHAHLPYVRHQEEDRLEERWLFEAMSETYIPLLWALEKLPVKHAVTISFTPPVMEMLSDPLVQTRYLNHLENTEQLLKKEEKRTNDQRTQNLVQFYKQRYEKLKATFLQWDRNLLIGFRTLMENEQCTLMTSAATHAFFPYLKTKEAIRAQVRHGIACFEQHFGKKPLGFWLPECAFSPGVDRILFEEGIRYTFVDEHAVLTADPTPHKGSSAPIYSPHGIALFPRHTELSAKVWSSTLGYPGDVDYREFYRDIAYDREWDYIKPHVHKDGIRIDTGLKYHRITGHTEEKDLYVREWAEKRVQEHANHFIGAIHHEIDQHGGQNFPPYVMVTPFDAELFGHWWFEGPEWIEALYEQGADRVSFITPELYLQRHYQDFQTAHVSFSTWGRDGYGHVWLNDHNAWMYRHYHRMEKDLAKIVAMYPQPTVLEKQAIQQMVREWMLAVSSDWAFILDGQTAAQYASERFHEHVRRFDTIQSALLEDRIDSQWLKQMLEAFPFLETIDERVFLSPHDRYVQSKKETQPFEGTCSILMLSWEYPPHVVGGLSRHVDALSQALAKKGHEIHVVTAAMDGAPEYKKNGDVHIHRVSGLQPEREPFLDWVASLNLAMFEHVKKLYRFRPFDIIHAHDWLVSGAALALKHLFQTSLMATIHATEHGRNQGIHTELQQAIHEQEMKLVTEADQIIVCSQFMKEHVQSLFVPNPDKVAVIANGVAREQIEAARLQTISPENRFIVFSVGRIVQEKGFSLLIEAAAKCKELGEPIQFVVAGHGPLLADYQQQVNERHLEAWISFVGYISDSERNEWYHRADVCIFPSLYEPFGIVALEAMAAGTPTIVSDTGGLAEIVEHGDNGLKVPTGDVDAIVAQLLSLYHKPLLRAQIGFKGSQDVIEQYSWETIADQTEAILVKKMKRDIYA